MIATKGLGNGGTNNTFEFRLNPSLVPEFAQVAGGTFYGGAANTALPLNAWSHIAVTKTSVRVDFWRNGNLDGSLNNVTGAVSTNANPVYLGTRGLRRGGQRV